MRQAFVHRIPMAGPDDVSGLIERVKVGDIEPSSIKAILGKTEGNGCVNDFTRGFAVQSLRGALSTWLDRDELDRIAMVMSGGTEGGLSPHILLFEARESGNPPADDDALYRTLETIGLAAKRRLSHEQSATIKGIFAKAEADPSSVIRGARHTMLDDSDIASTRHARALVGGVLAGIVGHTELFISGGAEHQGPPGGGPVAVIRYRA